MTPLVWSGEQQELAKVRDVRAGKKARLVQHARGLNRRNPKSNIRMNDEIRIISDREVKIIATFAGSCYGRSTGPSVALRSPRFKDTIP